MIKMEDEMSFDLPIATVWELINDKHTMAACIPTLKSYRIVDDDNVEGLVSVMLGALPIESRVSMTVLERNPPREVRAAGYSYLGEALAKPTKDGQPPSELKDSVGKFRVRVQLIPLSPESTSARVQVEVEAEGKLKRIYNMIMEKKLPALRAEFENKLRAAIAARIAPTPPPPTAGPIPSPQEAPISYSRWGRWLGRVVQLLNRLLG
jgi:carbon monoxide dehydrogenase subunit G